MTNADCQHARVQLDRYRDGDLPAAEREAIDAHLRACPACAAREADARTLGALLRLRSDAVAERGLPADLAERVMGALPPAASGFWTALAGRLRGQRMLIVGALAVTAVAAAVLLPLLGRQPRPPGGLRLGAREDEAHIHSISVRSPGAQPVVFQNDLGQTVVWVVPDGSAHDAGAH